MSSSSLQLHPRTENLIGRTFGALTVVGFAGYRIGARWDCRCKCGVEKPILGHELRRGHVVSCGCRIQQVKTERAEDHPDWPSFKGLLSRCVNKNDKGFPRYGGRGITVCARWREGGFWIFLADMGPRPTPDHSIDRIDNDGPYSPENCRWATAKEQQRNRHSNRIIEFRGERRTMAEWAETTGINVRCIQARLNSLGWAIEQALTVPSDSHAQHYRGLGTKRRTPKKPKYAPEIVAALRARVAAGESTLSVAKRIGVGRSAAYQIVSRQGVYS